YLQPMRRDGVRWWAVRALVVAGPCALMLLLPRPEDLSPEGQRVLAVAALAVALWGTETLPAGGTGVVVGIARVGFRAGPGMREALIGFADPIAYFLIGVLTIGLAVSHSGLAERVA